mgnify:CR=1 FL=1
MQMESDYNSGSEVDPDLHISKRRDAWEVGATWEVRGAAELWNWRRRTKSFPPHTSHAFTTHLHLLPSHFHEEGVEDMSDVEAEEEGAGRKVKRSSVGSETSS